MILKVNLGLDKWDLYLVIYMFLSNNPSSVDINYNVVEFVSCIFLELFPFDHLQFYFMSALYVENCSSYLNKASYCCRAQ